MLLLDPAVAPVSQSIGDPTFKVGHDVAQCTLDRFGCLDHRGQSGMSGPKIRSTEKRFGTRGISEAPETAQSLLDCPRSGRNIVTQRVDIVSSHRQRDCQPSGRGSPTLWFSFWSSLLLSQGRQEGKIIRSDKFPCRDPSMVGVAIGRETKLAPRRSTTMPSGKLEMPSQSWIVSCGCRVGGLIQQCRGRTAWGARSPILWLQGAAPIVQ